MTGRAHSAAWATASLFAMIAATPALAQTAAGPDKPKAVAFPPAASQLDVIVVTAERGSGTVNGSTATVSVKRAGDLERRLVDRPRDLVADEPGISIAHRPNRTGGANYNIRGITDNRVKLLVDGVTVPDYPSVLSSPGTYTRDFVDLENLRQVEIVRGPGSALYGSDAIGGVVGYVTKDPADFLAVFDKDWYAGVKTGFDTADTGGHVTTTVAGRAGPWSAMLSTTGRWGHEMRPNTNVPMNGRTGETTNPQTQFQGNVLAKVVHDTPDFGLLRLTVEHFRKQVDTRLDANLSASYTGGQASDETVRDRISLDWERALDAGLADSVKAKLFVTRLERTDESVESRLNVGPPPLFTGTQWRRDAFSQTVFGGEAQARKAFETFGLAHALTYGASLEVADTERLNQGVRVTSTGTVINTFGGDTYPHKKFPDTTTTKAAVFAQDVISTGAWRFIPALRLDYWNLTPHPDALFAASGTGTSAEQTAWSLSPKFGLTHDLTETWRLVAQYAHGFRAPPYDAVNYGFVNTLQGYQVLPNASLRPETSHGLELGLRGRFDDGSSLQLTGFYNLYKNFINLTYVSTSGGIQQYKHTNLDRVHIWGLEARGEWKVNPDLALYGSLAYAQGRDHATDRPLDTVNPFTAVIGARWKPAEHWTLEARAKGVAGKREIATPASVRTDGYAVADVFAAWEPSRSLSVNLGVLNLFDRSYFDPADLQNQTSLAERYRAAGRSFTASVTLRF